MCAYGSSKAVQNYSRTRGVEFVFDPKSGRFVMGRMKHFGLVDKAGVAADSTTVGGMIRRQGGQLVTNENSGHYGENWTDAIRDLFVRFMADHGVDINAMQQQTTNQQ